jgi:hypothetical protein
VSQEAGQGALANDSRRNLRRVRAGEGPRESLNHWRWRREGGGGTRIRATKCVFILLYYEKNRIGFITDVTDVAVGGGWRRTRALILSWKYNYPFKVFLFIYLFAKPEPNFNDAHRPRVATYPTLCIVSGQIAIKFFVNNHLLY